MGFTLLINEKESGSVFFCEELDETSVIMNKGENYVCTKRKIE